MTYVINFQVFTLLFLLPFFSTAQQTDSSDVATTAAKPLPELVVQATRTGAKSPIPHSNYSAAILAKTLQAQDVPMLLSAVPSLVETSDAGTGIGYTGMRVRGSDPTRVNVTLNGVPLNDSESQGVFWVDLPDLAASAAEIQVQRGVGTSTNGAGAFGATVNIDLSRVPPEPAASVSSTIGAFGTSKFSAQANSGLLSGKWAFSGRASTIYSEGYIDRGKAELSSLHLSAAYLGERQTWQAHLLSGREVTYQAWNGTPAQYLDDEKLRTFNTAGTERPGAPYDQEVDNYTQKHFLLHYKRMLWSQFTLQLNGHYTKGAGYYEQYKADEKYADYGLAPWVVGDSTIALTDLVRRRWLDNDYYGTTFVLRWIAPGRSKTTLQLGGAVSRYTGSHFGELIWTENPIGQPNDFRYYDNTADKRDANLYLKAEKDFSDNFTAFIDLQERMVAYDFLGYNNDLAPTDQSVKHYFFNPKIGATYTFSPAWTTYGFFGIAQREPNRDDYTQSSPSTRPKTERLADSELGVRFEGLHASASGNFFLMQYRDQLVLDGRINDVGAYIRTNVPNSYRAGLELEATARFGHRISVGANVALSQHKIKQFTEYLDNWDTYGQEVVVHQKVDLAFSPKVVGRGEVNFLLVGSDDAGKKAGNLRVTTTLSGKYVGQQYLDNTASDLASLPGYFVSDFRLNVDCAKLIGQEVSLIFSLNNWLDKRYASNGWVYRYISAGYDARADDPYTRLEGGDVYQQAGFFPQAGRHWMATLRVSF